MKLLFTLFLLSTSLTSQVWFQVQDFPGLKRDDGVAVTVNTTAYFGTGLIEWAATSDFYALDLNTLSWSNIPSMPGGTERQYACAFSGVGCFYVFGGDGSGGALNTLYKFTVTTNSWAAVAPKPGNGLIGASCMNFGDKVIIVCGKFTSGKASNEVWEYSINANSWAQKNSLPSAGRWRASATVLNNTGYLIFGRDTAGAYRKELYKYTPSADQWAKVMDFPLPYGRAYASLNVANNKLFLFGGIDTLGNYYKDIWYFNEVTTSWLQGPDLPAPGRKGGMSCTYNDKFFYTCGIRSGDQRLTETWMTDVPVGLKKFDKTQKFSIYPNPTSGMITFEADAAMPYNTTINISVTDLFGRRVLAEENVMPRAQLDLSALSSGFYWITVYSENKIQEVKKIIKN